MMRSRWVAPALLLAVCLWGCAAAPALSAPAEDKVYPCGPPNPSPLMAAAVEEIFRQSVPAGWQAIRGDVVNRAERKGVTLIMQKGQTMALIVAADELSEHDPLVDRHLPRVAYHLFENYVFGRPGYLIVGLGNDRMRVDGRAVRMSRLKVKFSDGFVEPDLIARVKKNDRLFIILLGQPSAGAQGLEDPGFKPFQEMKRELRQVVDAIAKSQS